jgi:hypothetical protein
MSNDEKPGPSKRAGWSHPANETKTFGLRVNTGTFEAIEEFERKTGIDKSLLLRMALDAVLDEFARLGYQISLPLQIQIMGGHANDTGGIASPAFAQLSSNRGRLGNDTKSITVRIRASAYLAAVNLESMTGIDKSVLLRWTLDAILEEFFKSERISIPIRVSYTHPE